MSCFGVRGTSFVLAVGALVACSPEGGTRTEPTSAQRQRLALSVGPAVAVDTPVYESLMPATQHAPVIATDGERSLVAWDDTRSAAGSAVYAARIDADGVLDANGVLLGQTATTLTGLDMAFDGAAYLVVWAEGDAAGTLRGARVAPDGTLLDTTPLAIASGAAERRHPVVAPSAAGFVVAWAQGSGPAAELRAARVTAEGSVTDSGGIVVVASEVSGPPALAFNGSNHLLTWSYTDATSSAIFGARLAADLSVLDSPALVFSQGDALREAPDVASDGTGYLVAWTDHRAEDFFAPDIYGIRVGGDGIPIDAESFAIDDTPAGQYEPAVSFDGGDYHVTFMDERIQTTGVPAIFSTPVATQGAISGIDNIALFNDAGFGRPDAVNVLGALVIVAETSSSAVAQFQHTNPSSLRGPPDDPLWLSDVANTEHAPVLACSTESCMVAWHDDRDLWSFQSDVFGVRFDHSLQVLDDVPFAIRVSPYFEILRALSFGTDAYMALFDTGSYFPSPGVSFMRLTSDGPPWYGDQYMPGRRNRDSAVDFDGTNHLIAWLETRDVADDPFAEQHGLYAARVAADGTLLDPDRIRIDVARTPAGPVVSAGAEQFLVVWREYSDGPTALRGLRITSAGARLGEPFEIAATLGYGPAAVAFDGSTWLVLWTDPTERGDEDVFATRVDEDGHVLDAPRVSISSHESQESDVQLTYDGSGYVAAWVRDEAGNSDVVGARFTLGNLSEDPEAVPLAAGPDDEHSPTLARMAQGKVALAYERFVPDAGYRTSRVYIRALDALDFDGVACSADSACASGFCVDGVCCDSRCSGQCEACDVAANPGACTAVTGAPHGSREACSGEGPCAATCDGTERTACTLPASGTECGAARCEQGIAYPAPQCDGAGQCVTAAQVSCGAFACDTTSCLSSCTADVDCAPRLVCDDGACVAPELSGSAGAAGGPGPGTVIIEPPRDGGCSCRFVRGERGASTEFAAWGSLLLAVFRRRRAERRVK